MRKILFLILFLFLVRPVEAIDSTPSATSSKAAEIVQAVSKWAEKTSDKKIYVGAIKSVGTSSYMVDINGGEKTISTNDVTNFYRFKSGKRTDTSFKNIVKGDDISAIGTIDPQTGEMTAKQIMAKLHRINMVGTITTLTGNNLASITDSTGKITKVDLSDASSYKKIDDKGKIVKASINDFKENSLVFVIAYANDGTDTLSALKAMVMGKTGAP